MIRWILLTTSFVMLPVGLVGLFLFVRSAVAVGENWSLPSNAAAHQVHVLDVCIRSMGGDPSQAPKVLTKLCRQGITPDAENEQQEAAIRIRRAYQNPEDYAAAQGWALSLAERLITIEQLRANAVHVALDQRQQQVVTTNANDLLISCLGVDEESRQAAQQRWASCFPRERLELALRIGGQLESERRAAGETFPPTSTNLALTCLVERISGTDPYGIRCRELLGEAYSRYRPSAGMLAMAGILPYEEVQIVSMSASPLGDLHLGGEGGLSFLLVLVVFAGARVLIKSLIGKLFLFLHDDTLFRSFEMRHSALDPSFRRGMLFSFLITPLLYFPIVLFTLPGQLKVLLTTEEILIGTYLSLWFSGVIFMSLSLLVAVILIRLGIDPDKSWLDEIIIVPLMIIFLLHFGVGVLSIVATVVFVLVPQLFVRCSKSSRRSARDFEIGKAKRPRSVDAIDLMVAGIRVFSRKD